MWFHAQLAQKILDGIYSSHAVACIVPFILFRSEFRLDVYVRCPQLLCRWNGNGMKNENGIKYILTRMNTQMTEVKGRNIPEDIFMLH